MYMFIAFASVLDDVAMNFVSMFGLRVLRNRLWGVEAMAVLLRLQLKIARTSKHVNETLNL